MLLPLNKYNVGHPDGLLKKPCTPAPAGCRLLTTWRVDCQECKALVLTLLPLLEKDWLLQADGSLFDEKCAVIWGKRLEVKINVMPWLGAGYYYN